MSAVRHEVTAVSATNRARVTNRPHLVAGADGRSARSRRRRDMINGLIEALGGNVSVTTMADVTRAVDLGLVCEAKRAAALRGEAVDLDALARLENAADRAMRRLNLKPGSASSSALPWTPARGRLAAQLAADGETAGAGGQRGHAAPAQAAGAS